MALVGQTLLIFLNLFIGVPTLDFWVSHDLRVVGLSPEWGLCAQCRVNSRFSLSFSFCLSPCSCAFSLFLSQINKRRGRSRLPANKQGAQLSLGLVPVLWDHNRSGRQTVNYLCHLDSLTVRLLIPAEELISGL